MKLGLVLSGGGIRGAAHIGVIKALEENGIKADIVAGTSAGSMVSVLYALGYKSNEMYKFLKKYVKTIMGMTPKYLLANLKENDGIKVKGMISGLNIEKIFEEISKERNVEKISDLQMPIAIVSTDLLHSQKVVFTNDKALTDNYYLKDIDIGKAVRASCSVPGVYNPVNFKDYQLVDGGLFNNLPVDEAKKMGADKIIAIKFNIKNNKKYNSLYNIAMQSLDLMTENLIQENIKKADVLIDLDLKDVKYFNLTKMEFCYEQGYKQTMEQIEKIKEII